MSYYKILGLRKEPFSTSPDPEFFYESKGHEYALTNLMIELRLKRGLSVILGDVGTGKTTLSRKLVQQLSEREDFIFNIIMDPSFDSEEVFLRQLSRNFEVPLSSDDPGGLDLKEGLESYLYKKGVEEHKTVVLIIDEAQKLNDLSLEVLRVLLNYETNEFKLLQLILLGQMELYAKIMNIPNFLDRISFKYALNPLDIEETMALIGFRLRQAGYNSPMRLFTHAAVREIHKATKGCPRQIGMFCHRALKHLVMKNRFVIDETLVYELLEQQEKSGWPGMNQDLLQKSNS
jgi:general secretion pathway protein A